MPLKGVNGGRRVVKKVQTQPIQSPQHDKTTKGWMAFYITGAVVFVLLGATYVYTSANTSTSVYAVPSSEGQGEMTIISEKQPAPNDLPPPIREAAPETIHANAVINVPSVGLRNAPDITAKTVSGRLKRGEAVEIVKRHASWGPEWVKIRTQSGKLGWVFASIVKEHKGA
jgi:hypothetical protein